MEHVPLRSVETPVAKRPRDATASEPPRSVMQARVPPWRMLRRFCRGARSDATKVEELLAGERLYGVLFLDVQLEVDNAWSGGCDAELVQRV